MNKTFQLSKRITKKYNGECKHLDQWEPVTDMTVLGKMLTDNNGDGWKEISIIKVADLNGEVIGAIHDTFDIHGCSCEHDCCGCVNVTVMAVKVIDSSLGLLYVTTSHSPNY